jgi:hypothetical protein
MPHHLAAAIEGYAYAAQEHTEKLRTFGKLMRDPDTQPVLEAACRKFAEAKRRGEQPNLVNLFVAACDEAIEQLTHQAPPLAHAR